MLKRVVQYADRMFGLKRNLEAMRDGRPRPRIPASLVIKGLMVMLLARLGSLNGLEQVRPKGWLRRWLGGDVPSADTMGRVAQGVSPEPIRQALGRQYGRRRRNKSLAALPSGLRPVIFDGHEACASYYRHCPECSTRTVHMAQGDRTQYYHRYVLALLALPQTYLLLDVEMHRPGEDETACAKRLLERLLERFPRAFNVVCGDNLYMNPGFCKVALEHGKDFIVVLKNENRDLLKDARGLFDRQVPRRHRRKKTTYLWWDLEGFTSWESIDAPVRVVRSVETKPVPRGREGLDETVRSEWVWVTTLPQRTVSTGTIVRLGHGRWAIENYGFNELANQWHADHVYKHAPNALLVLWLLVCLAYNLFHTFLSRNVKSVLRARHSAIHFAQIVAASLCVFSFP